MASSSTSAPPRTRRLHAQWAQGGGGGPVEALREPVYFEAVHEEADRPAVHAEDGDPELHVPVERIEHEPVSAERDDDIGSFDGMLPVAPGELAGGVPGLFRGQERDALNRHRCRRSACTGR